MSESTVNELAEVIADQNCQIRELQGTIEAQNDLLAGYELQDEEASKIDAALYADLVDLDDGGCKFTIREIIERYFAEFDSEFDEA